MSSLKSEESIAVKNRRIPNAFMIFVKEQRASLLQDCPIKDRNEIAAFLGRKWRSMPLDEKQLYFDKYNALKKTMVDKSVADLNYDMEGKLKEDGELSTEIYTNEENMVADHETSKISNKATVDDVVDNGTAKKFDPNSPTWSDIDCLSTKKQKSVKKARRPPNAFMLFANEKRSSIDTSIVNDKKCHANSVLGNMWRALSDSEKAKYLSEARRLLALHKNSDTTSCNKNLKKAKKVRFKLPKQFSRRPCQSKKVRPSKTASSSRGMEANDIKKSEVESKSNKPIADKIENPGNTQLSTEPHSSNDCTSSSSQSQLTTTKSHPQRTAPSTEELHQSNHCCCRPTLSSHCSNNEIFKQYSPSDTGMSSSCFGAGFLPPMLPSYPFNMPFSMYHQAMTHPMFPFPSMGFPPSPALCGCSSPYFYNSTYFNAYSSLYSGRVMNPFPYSSHSSASASANGASTKDEAVEAAKIADNSEDEELIVDETSDAQKNETSD